MLALQPSHELNQATHDSIKEILRIAVPCRAGHALIVHPYHLEGKGVLAPIVFHVRSIKGR